MNSIVILQADKTITSPHFFGHLKRLRFHLTNVNSKDFSYDAAQLLLTELDRRFAHFINHTDHKFDPHYVLCALMDPSQAFLLVDFDEKLLASLLASVLDNFDPNMSSLNETFVLSENDQHDLFEKMMEEKARKRRTVQDHTKYKVASNYVESVISLRGESASVYWTTKGRIEHVSFSLKIVKYFSFLASNCRLCTQVFELSIDLSIN